MTVPLDLNDVPTVGNRWLLTDVPRGQMRVKGRVVSDANGTGNQIVQHSIRESADAAGCRLAAGNDMEVSFGPTVSMTTRVASVRAGKLSGATLDQAVRRILITRFRMGVFEHPCGDEIVQLSIHQQADMRSSTARRPPPGRTNDRTCRPLEGTSACG